jgi:hypothetical protein
VFDLLTDPEEQAVRVVIVAVSAVEDGNRRRFNVVEIGNGPLELPQPSVI